MSETTPQDHPINEHTGTPDAAGGADADGHVPADAIEETRAEAAQLKDQFLRKIAEFENYKRRTREEKDLLMKYGSEGVLLDLLPVIDDFERTIAATKGQGDVATIAQGVELIYGKFMRVLENRGLRPMDATGEPFDVDFHDALLQVPSADVEPGTVLEVVEKGYLLHDKVIRHAKVTVSREADAEGAA